MAKYYNYTLNKGCSESELLPTNPHVKCFNTAEARQEWLDAQVIAAQLYRVQWHNMPLNKLREIIKVTF
jgi:hypothetical protein